MLALRQLVAGLVLCSAAAYFALMTSSFAACVSTAFAIAAGWWIFRLRLAQGHVRVLPQMGFREQMRWSSSALRAGAQFGAVAAIVLGAVLSGGGKLVFASLVFGFLGGLFLSLRFSPARGRPVEVS